MVINIQLRSLNRYFPDTYIATRKKTIEKRILSLIGGEQLILIEIIVET